MTKAQASFHRADRLYHLALRAFYIFAFIMLIIIVYQVAQLQTDFNRQQTAATEQRDEDTAAARKRLEAALGETNRQQTVTQNYIRCIASVLLKPVSERDESDFDDCGIPGVTDPSRLGQPNTNQKQGSSTQRAMVVAPVSQQNPQPTSGQPTTSAPPDPDQETENPQPTILGLPKPSSVLEVLGL